MLKGAKVAHEIGQVGYQELLNSGKEICDLCGKIFAFCSSDAENNQTDIPDPDNAGSCIRVTLCDDCMESQILKDPDLLIW